jgi:hypothetical protein
MFEIPGRYELHTVCGRSGYVQCVARFRSRHGFAVHQEFGKRLNRNWNKWIAPTSRRRSKSSTDPHLRLLSKSLIDRLLTRSH